MEVAFSDRRNPSRTSGVEEPGVSQGRASKESDRSEPFRADRETPRQRPADGPTPEERGPRGRKVEAIGVVVARHLSYTFRDPFMRLLLGGVADECDVRGVGLTFLSAERQGEPGWTSLASGVDGLVACCLRVGEELVSFARERGIPFVSVDLDVGPGTSSILIEDRRGGYAAARHLLELGHRRIGFLAFETGPLPRYGWADAERLLSTEHRFEHDRIVGYAEALAEHGVELRQLPIMEAPNDRAGAASYADALLASDPSLTAIVAMSDVLALAALDAARARGLRVPQDLSVIGFDDVPEAALADPPLTTVAQPIIERGRLAAQLILDLEPPRVEVFGVKLVLRESTGRPRLRSARASRRAGKSGLPHVR